MGFDEFRAEFVRVHRQWSFGQLGTAQVRNSLAVLRDSAAALGGSEGGQASVILDDFAAEITAPAQLRMALACQRLASARPGSRADVMADITRIADKADTVNEQYNVLTMNTQLADLEAAQGHPVPGSDDDVRVLAHVGSQGTPVYDAELVSDPLRIGLGGPAGDAPLDTATRQRIRNASRVTMNVTARTGQRDSAPGSAADEPVDAPGSAEFRDGVLEVWTYTGLDAYLESMAFDAVVPGVAALTCRCGFPEYAPGAYAVIAALETALDEAGGRSAAEQTDVIGELVNAGPQHTWYAAAALLLEAQNARRHLSARQAQTLTATVAKAMRLVFADTAQIAATDGLSEAKIRAASARIGQETYDAGLATLRHTRR